MKEPKMDIKCRIFLQKELILLKIIRDINNATNRDDEIEMANRFINEVNELLSCAKFNEIEDCKNCRIIADIRKKTAELLIIVRSKDKT